MSKLRQAFFRQKTKKVAKELLGKVLVRKSANRRGGKILSGIIVETEAYVGAHDQACHASRGKTKRNKVMFEEAGVWYVYMIYGLHFNLNVVTEGKDNPCAVLIRALEPLQGIEQMKKNRKTDNVFSLTSGPGKLCQALKIDKRLNYTWATRPNSKLYIEDRGIIIPSCKIQKARRVGIDYAGAWKDKPLRFYIKNNIYVLKK